MTRVLAAGGIYDTRGVRMSAQNLQRLLVKLRQGHTEPIRFARKFSSLNPDRTEALPELFAGIIDEFKRMFKYPEDSTCDVRLEWGDHLIGVYQIKVLGPDNEQAAPRVQVSDCLFPDREAYSSLEPVRDMRVGPAPTVEGTKICLTSWLQSSIRKYDEMLRQNRIAALYARLPACDLALDADLAFSDKE